MAHQITREADNIDIPEPSDPSLDVQEDAGGSWVFFAIVTPLPWKLTNTYGFSIVAEIAGWISQALEEAVQLDSQPHWISTYQLYLDYQLATGKPGPIYDKKWIDPGVRPDFRLRTIPFRKRCAWFTKILKKIFVASGGHVSVKVTRPYSVAIASHTACFWIPWNANRLHWIEQWTSQRLPRSVDRDGKLCDGPSVPQRDGRWPVFSLEESPLSL